MLEREQGILFCLVGATGSGKTTIAKRLKEDYSPSLVVATSVTTRPMRPGEVDGISYYFVSESEFKRMEREGELFESENVHGNWYGQRKSELERVLREPVDVVLDIDIGGVRSIRKGFPQQTVAVFIVPPSPQELLRRLVRRGGLQPGELEKRLATAKKEYDAVLETAGSSELIDYIITNNDFIQCYREVGRILETERQRFSRLRVESARKLLTVEL